MMGDGSRQLRATSSCMPPLQSFCTHFLLWLPLCCILVASVAAQESALCSTCSATRICCESPNGPQCFDGTYISKGQELVTKCCPTPSNFTCSTRYPICCGDGCCSAEKTCVDGECVAPATPPAREPSPVCSNCATSQICCESLDGPDCFPATYIATNGEGRVSKCCSTPSNFTCSTQFPICCGNRCCSAESTCVDDECVGPASPPAPLPVPGKCEDWCTGICCHDKCYNKTYIGLSGNVLTSSCCETREATCNVDYPSCCDNFCCKKEFTVCCSRFCCPQGNFCCGDSCCEGGKPCVNNTCQGQSLTASPTSNSGSASPAPPPQEPPSSFSLSSSKGSSLVSWLVPVLGGLTTLASVLFYVSISLEYRIRKKQVAQLTRDLLAGVGFNVSQVDPLIKMVLKKWDGFLCTNAARDQINNQALGIWHNNFGEHRAFFLAYAIRNVITGKPLGQGEMKERARDVCDLVKDLITSEERRKEAVAASGVFTRDSDVTVQAYIWNVLCCRRI